MSHFTVLVIERAGHPDAEALLAPFDENLEVAPYETPCYCVNHNLRVAVDAAVARASPTDPADRRANRA